MKHKNSQSGNALWFILIAIALLGGLNVMLTRSSNTSNETGEYERFTIQANEVLNYAKSIETAVQNLRTRGCSESDLSFENSIATGYINANSPTDKSCHIFDPAGAGLTYIAPNKDWLDSTQSTEALYGEVYFNSRTCVSEVGGGPVGCATGANSFADLILTVPYITRDFCQALNKTIYGTTTIPVETANAWSNSNAKFTGSFINGTVISSAVGSHKGCFEGDAYPASGSFHFYYVILAR